MRNAARARTLDIASFADWRAERKSKSSIASPNHGPVPNIIMTCGSKCGRHRPRSAGYWRALWNSIFPNDIAQYSEGYIYAAVKTINRVQDPIAGQINWYVIGERKPGSDPSVDFHGIRVFTWNMKKHRYETAFRTSGMRGVYPLADRPGRRQSHVPGLRIGRGRHDEDRLTTS